MALPESPCQGRMRPVFGLAREKEEREACNGMQVLNAKAALFSGSTGSPGFRGRFSS